MANRETLVGAILKEIKWRGNFFNQGTPIRSVYLGGGTPSLLTRSEIAKILHGIRRQFLVTPNAEITLEANPDDLNPEYLADLRRLGINRLSIGVQSLDDDILRYMNRSHKAAQAMRCLDEAAAAGFDNVSADLIYGVPGMSVGDWERTLDDILKFPLAHLSAYSLTVEPRTALHHFIKKKGWAPPDEDIAAKHFLLASEMLEDRGFNHYEVSNFARPGRKSRHNKSYWEGKTYLGLGPSAHSYQNEIRFWNVSSNAGYIAQAESNKFQPERESLTLEAIHNEYVMTRLRTSRGVNLDEVEFLFGPVAAMELAETLRANDERHFEERGNRIRLTREGWLFADAIASDCFMDDDDVYRDDDEDDFLITEFPKLG